MGAAAGLQIDARESHEPHLAAAARGLTFMVFTRVGSASSSASVIQRSVTVASVAIMPLMVCGDLFLWKPCIGNIKIKPSLAAIAICPPVTARAGNGQQMQRGVHRMRA